jgi:hypothetical protein
MTLKLNQNSGLAFRNTRGLERSEKAPQWKGEIDFEGRKIEVAIWERTSKSNQKMLCFNVQDAVAAELKRTEDKLAYLQNISEAEAK